MATQFNIAAGNPKAVSFKFQVGQAGISAPTSADQKIQLWFVTPADKKEFIGQHTLPVGLTGGANPVTFWISAVLPEGDYTIDEDADCVLIRGGLPNAGVSGVKPLDFVLTT